MNHSRDRNALAAICPVNFDIDDVEYHDIKFETNASGASVLKKVGYGGIELYKITETVHGAEKKVYDAFEIAVCTEYRDVVDSNILKATLLGKHEVAVQLPAMNTQFYKDYNDVVIRSVAEGDSMAHKNYFDERLTLAHQKARQKVTKAPHLLHRIVILKFPRTIELSNELYSPKSVDGKIDINLFPMFTQLDETLVTAVRASWIVHIHNDDADQIAEAQSIHDKNLESISTLKHMFGKLGMARRTQDDDDFDM